MAVNTTLNFTVLGNERGGVATFEKLTASLDRLNRSLNQLNRQRVNVKVDVDDKGAATKLGLISHQLQDLNRHVGAAHVQWNKLGVLWGSHNIQRAGTAFAATFKIVGVAAAGMGAAIAASGIASLGAQVVLPAVGALGLLPAVLVAAGATAGVLAVGMSGMGDAFKLINSETPLTAAQQQQLAAQLKNMAPAAVDALMAIKGLHAGFIDIRKSVQGALFEGIGVQIRDLGTTYIPVVKTGLTGMAIEMNAFVRASAGVFQQPDTVAKVADSFANMRLAAAGFTQAAIPGTNAMVNLVAVGSTELPILSNALGQAGARFGDFINKAAASGQLKTFFDQAVALVFQLVGLIGNLGSILLSVFQAASASGMNFLGLLSQGTASLAAFFKSAEGQTVLITFFATASQTLANLMPLLRAFGSVLVSTILPAIETMLPTIGTALGNLAPAIAPLGAMVAALAPVLGQVALSLSSVLVAGMQALLPIVQALSPLLLELANVIGSSLVSMIQQLAPSVLIVARALTSALAPVLPQIANAFVQIALALMPVINAAVGLAPVFGAIAQAVAQVATALAPLISMVATIFLQVLQATAPVLNQIVTLLGQVLVAAINAVLPVLQPLINAFISIVQAVLPIVPQLLQMATLLINALAPILPVIANLIVTLVNALLPLLPPLIDITIALLPPFIALVNALLPIISALANLFAAVVVPILQLLVIPALQAVAWVVSSVLGPILTWLINAIVRPVFIAIGAQVQGTATFLNVIFDGIKAGLNLVGQTFQFVGGWIANVWNGLREAAASPIRFVVNTVINGLIRGWNNVVGFLGLNGLKLGEIRLGFAQGGLLSGPGGPTDDKIPIMASPGEYYVNAKSTRKHLPVLEAINADRFASGGLVGDFSSWFTNPAGSLMKQLGSLIPGSSGHGVIGDAMLGFPRKLLSNMGGVISNAVGDLIRSFSSQISGLTGGILTAIVGAVLKLLNQPTSAIGAVLHRIQQESGGNANAVNRWDSNWQAGHPSVGLMQVIAGTFAAYAGPFRNQGPFLYGVSTNPLANIYAGINYATHRYGTGWITKMMAPGGYATGGIVTRPTLGMLGESGTEVVLPMSRPRRVAQLMRQAGLAGGGGPVEIAFMGNTDSALATAIMKMIRDNKIQIRQSQLVV